MTSPIILCIVCLMVMISLKIPSGERVPGGDKEETISPENDFVWMPDLEVEELAVEASGPGPIDYQPTYWMLL